MYKLISSDIDGTLNNDKGCMSKENMLAIEKLSEMGIEFVPTTGRTLAQMEEVMNLPQVRYVIFSNGSTIYDKKTDTYTYMCISKETAKEVLDLLAEYECYIIVHHGGKNYEKTYTSFEELKKYSVGKIVFDMLEKDGTDVDDFEEFIRTLDNIESFAVFFSTAEERDRCKEVLSRDSRLFVAGAWENNLEIFSIEAGKDKALKKLADMLGIDMKDVIALGDNENDAEMLKAAGLGLCVSNGKEAAKQAADKVICTNNEHVVKYTIEEILTK